MLEIAEAPRSALIPQVAAARVRLYRAAHAVAIAAVIAMLTS